MKLRIPLIEDYVAVRFDIPDHVAQSLLGDAGIVVAQQRFSGACDPDFRGCGRGFPLRNVHMHRFQGIALI
jgi:hypothetical protein